MNKQLFDDAIGEVPPSTVDVDAAIARGRRAARVRRLGSPAAAVTAGVVLVAAALLTPVGDGLLPRGGGPADQSGCDDLLPTAPALTERPKDTASRLTDVLAPLVGSRLPAGSQLGKPWDRPPGISPEPLVFFHNFAAPRDIGFPGDCFVGWDDFTAAADVTRNGTTGAVRVIAGRLGGFNSIRAECDPSPEETYCEERTGPNGEQIVVTTLKVNDTLYQVDVAKPDGTGVTVSATNDAHRGEDAGAHAMAEPPLTHQQLLDIALDPGLTLYPSS